MRLRPEGGPVCGHLVTSVDVVSLGPSVLLQGFYTGLGFLFSCVFYVSVFVFSFKIA